MKKSEFVPLKYIADDRGAVMHFVKKNDSFIKPFGECYFSWINPHYVKGWYKHTNLTSCLTSPTTNLRIVTYNGKDAASFSVTDISKDHYGLIKIPSGIWYSFKSLDNNPALIVNFLSGLYDPSEVTRLPIDTDKIPYDWNQNA